MSRRDTNKGPSNNGLTNKGLEVDLDLEVDFSLGDVGSMENPTQTPDLRTASVRPRATPSPTPGPIGRPTTRTTDLVLGLFVLGILGPVVLGSWSSLDSRPQLLALGVLYAAAVRLTVVASQQPARLGLVIYWLFVYVYFGLAATAQEAGPDFPLVTAGYPARTQLIVVLMLIISSIGFEVSYHLTRTRPRAATRPSYRPSDPGFVLTFAGLAALASIVLVSGGLAVFLSSREEFSTALLGAPEVAGRFFDVADNPLGRLHSTGLRVGPLMLALAAVWRFQYPARRGALLTYILVLGLATSLLLLNPTIVPRTLIGAALVGMWVLSYRRTARHLMVATLIMVVLLTGVASSFNTFRRATQAGADHVSGLVGADFSSYQQTLNGVTYTDEHGHTMGEQLTGSVTILVPRAVWNGKPGDTGQLIQGDLSNVNPNAPMWAELYVDFGLIGVAAGFALLGTIARRADDRLIRSTGPGEVTVALAAMYGLGLLLLRGSFGTFVSLLIPAVLLAKLLTTTEPVVTTAPDATNGLAPPEGLATEKEPR